jgi:hypothetical protein
MVCGALRWVQGAVDEGAGGLFLARDRMGVDGVQDGGAVPGAGRCFLGCDPGGEPQRRCGVAQVVGPAGERGGGQARAERGGAGGVPGAAVYAAASRAILPATSTAPMTR